MRIGIDCHDFEQTPRWGIGRQIEYILKTVAENSEFQKGNEFFLYFKNRVPEENFLKNSVFKKRVLKLIKPSFSLYYNVLLPLRAKIDKVDVMFFPANMLPILYFGRSIVHLPVDVFFEIKHGNLALRHKIGYKVLSTWAMRHATKITTNSEYSKKELAKLFPRTADKIIVNPLGVDNQKFKPSQGSKKGNFILNVGQCFPRRMTKEIIEAFCIFSKNSVNKLKLIIVGKDKYRPPILDNLIKVKNQELSYNAITKIDDVSDNELIQLYQEAKILLYISSSEAQGLPPLEALACGTPILVAENELSKEIFDNLAFFVKNPDNPDSIYEALKSALEDIEKQKNIINNNNMMLSKFNWHNHVEKILETANNICQA
ncbi:MAG: glycosyltransferase family 4 protein [Parcubacteria group bacterium]|nr:glycosyltransferase family 4 protein [Parcubacteria group bacterium]